MAKYPHVFLVWAPSARTPAAHTAGRQSLAFHTQVHGSQLAGEVDALSSDRDVMLLPVIKAEGNPFPERISLGRAPNCDIVVRDGSVSKLHGHFRDVTPERALYIDANSANGTYLNGEQAAPGASVEVRSYAHLTFGRVRVQLLASTDVYDWL